jgi:uncharacterized protein YggE
MKIPHTVLLVLATATHALAGDTGIPHVTVFGTAVTQAKPDLLRWYLTVSDKGTELPAVSEVHTSHTAAVLRLLGEKAIRPEETQTSGMRFSEGREYRDNSWVKDGYVATTQISFTMRNPADYREVWLELARLAGVSVDSVTWDVSNRIEVQDGTRLEALRSAKAKAEQMAAALNGKVSEPIAIEEVLTEDPWAARSMMSNSLQEGSREDEGGDVISPGAVTIRIRVRVVFHLVTP